MTTKKLKDAPEPTGVLAERKQQDGFRRRIKLSASERKQLAHQKLCEQAALLFLDIETPRTWAAVAEELGISVHRLRDLTKSEEFDEAYNRLFPEIGHDPRYKAAIGTIGDLLPAAVRRLEELLTGSRVPAAVTMKAIEKILAINGVENLKPAQSDRTELVKFLEQKGVTIENLNVNIPPEYMNAMREYEVVEGQFRTDNSDEDQGKSDNNGSAGLLPDPSLSSELPATAVQPVHSSVPIDDIEPVGVSD